MEKIFEVRYLDVYEDSKEWDRVISCSDLSTFFHTSYWLKVMEKTYNLKPYHLILLNKEEPILAIPMFLLKNAIHSPYIADYGGASINPKYAYDDLLINSAFKHLYKEIKIIGKKERLQATYLRGFHASKTQGKYLEELGFKRISTHLTYTLSDFYDVEDTMSIFHKKTRNAVRKAQKEDIDVDFISQDSKTMKDYRSLHVMTKEKHGSDPFPDKFFDLLSIIPSKNIEILIARYNETNIAGLLVFKYNNRYHILDNCSDPNYLKYNPNNLLYYTIIEKAKADKMEVDFGRTSPEDKNLCQFKERWGGKMISFYTYRKIMPPVPLNTYRLWVGRKKRRNAKKASLHIS